MLKLPTLFFWRLYLQFSQYNPTVPYRDGVSDAKNLKFPSRQFVSQLVAKPKHLRFETTGHVLEDFRFILFLFLLIDLREREEEGERARVVVPLICAFRICSLLLPLVWDWGPTGNLSLPGRRSKLS